MMPPETRSLKEIPHTLLERCVEQLQHFTVAFVRLERSETTEDAFLLGTGVLIEVGSVRAILTADHVLDVLPRRSRLGLALSERAEQTTVNVGDLKYLSIDRGNNPEHGPDIGAVLLSHPIATALQARKSFFNLDVHQERMSSDPPDIQNGFWIVQGFVDEMTVLDPDTAAYQRVKGFCNYGAIGGVTDYVSIGEHDYYTFPVSEPPSETVPNSFGGCSGGGLWHVLLAENKNREIEVVSTLLQGLAYFQQPPDEGLSGLRCHGQTSIYGVVCSSLRQLDGQTD